MNHLRGGQIAKRNVHCVKEFAQYKPGGCLLAPMQGTRWGIGKRGKVLRRTAERKNIDCGRGVHAWRPTTWKRQGFQFGNWGSRMAWHCVIPKGTWYHIGDGKFRADAIKLVKEIPS